MAISASINHDQAVIDSVLAELTLPKGVSLPKLQFGDDHTHDPAVWLEFAVDTDVPLTKPRVRTLADFSWQVSRALYDKGIDRIPYVRFTEVRRRLASR